MNAIGVILCLLGVDFSGQDPLRLEEVARFGTLDDFTSVSAVSVSTDGKVAVVDGVERHVFICTKDGRDCELVGHRGQGPGEFEMVGRIGWRGDTLWVTDPLLGRVTRFSKTGAVYSSQAYQGPHLAEGLRASSPDGYLVDGTQILMPSASASAMAGGVYPSLPVLAVRDGEVLAVVSNRPGGHQLWLIRFPDGGRMSTTQPFAIVSDWDVFPDGRGTAFARGIAPISNGRSNIEVVSIRDISDTVFAVRIPYSPVRPQQSRVDSAIAFVTRELGRFWGDRVGADRAARAGLYVPEFLPPFSKVVAGVDGSVWLRREDPSVWMAIDQDGRLIGDLHLSQNADLVQASLQSVIIASKDSLDRVQPVRYRVVR
jgi:hypothetical protein